MHGFLLGVWNFSTWEAENTYVTFPNKTLGTESLMGFLLSNISLMSRFSARGIKHTLSDSARRDSWNRVPVSYRLHPMYILPVLILPWILLLYKVTAMGLPW